ncbi:hypothetical protein HPB49_007642 [Dermacentor silvarum]|uniref:Uncharacterized protein n=1 Tax=Dermacentor silvarum TaxID=543639 RepID=A0ACB8CVU8_DERSI|nr:hypothetical protein HPB49_007642 [Dermacentor silvarum]
MVTPASAADLAAGHPGLLFLLACNPGSPVRPDTGEVVVREPNGLQGLYRLVVSASDGRSETATLVMVSIGRANVGRLRFARPLWEAAVHENEPTEQRVLLLSLLGAAVGEPVQFSLLTPSDYFAVGAHSGLVRCLAPLDREKQALHELALEASSARAVAHALLRVRVMDTNDNAPIFVNRPYYSVITVNAQPGDLVLKVEAIDLDEGPNGELLYSLHEGDSQMFDVDERTHRQEEESGSPGRTGRGSTLVLPATLEVRRTGAARYAQGGATILTQQPPQKSLRSPDCAGSTGRDDQ